MIIHLGIRLNISRKGDREGNLFSVMESEQSSIHSWGHKAETDH